MSGIKCLRPRLATSNPGGWKPDAIRGSRQARGYGAEWERLRKRILERDEGLCQECARHGRVTLGTECDHVVPKSQGGTDDESNLEMKCAACHRAKTSRESQGGEGFQEFRRSG